MAGVSNGSCTSCCRSTISRVGASFGGCSVLVQTPLARPQARGIVESQRTWTRQASRKQMRTRGGAPTAGPRVQRGSDLRARRRAMEPLQLRPMLQLLLGLSQGRAERPKCRRCASRYAAHSGGAVRKVSLRHRRPQARRPRDCDWEQQGRRRWCGLGRRRRRMAPERGQMMHRGSRSRRI